MTTTRIFYILTIIFLVSVQCNVSGLEEDVNFCVLDKEPWKQSWVQEDNGSWKLSLIFDNAIMYTYFNERPKETSFLGLSESNKPIRQEVILPGASSKLVLTRCQFERFGDGSVA